MPLSPYSGKVWSWSQIQWFFFDPFSNAFSARHSPGCNLMDQLDSSSQVYFQQIIHCAMNSGYRHTDAPSWELCNIQTNLVIVINSVYALVHMACKSSQHGVNTVKISHKLQLVDWTFEPLCTQIYIYVSHSIIKKRKFYKKARVSCL